MRNVMLLMVNLGSCRAPHGAGFGLPNGDDTGADNSLAVYSTVRFLCVQPSRGLLQNSPPQTRCFEIACYQMAIIR